jgi:hypothetical protein
MSCGPVVGGLGGFVRLVDISGGVERDAGVCMPLSLGEVEADDESLFVDDERSWVTCESRRLEYPGAQGRWTWP